MAFEISPLTVEIFHDRDSADINTTEMESAIAYVGAVAGGGVELVGTHRAIRIGTEQRGYADIEQTRWPDFKADLNIVATQYPIYDLQKGQSRRGLSHFEYARRSGTIGLSRLRGGLGNLALVDVNKADDVSGLTAAHEIGHLLGVSRTGRNADGSGHCTNANCLMHAAGGYVHSNAGVRAEHVCSAFCTTCRFTVKKHVAGLRAAKTLASLATSR